MEGKIKSIGYPFWKERFTHLTYLELAVYSKKKNAFSKYSNNLDSQILGPSIINYGCGLHEVSKEDKYALHKIKFDEDKRYLF